MSHPALVGQRQVAGIQPAQVLAFLVGLIYLAAGVVGFTRTGITDWSTANSASLAGFHVNAWHNLVHTGAGVIGLLFAANSGAARTFGWLLFVVFGAVLLWGLAITGAFASNPLSSLGNPLRLNAADNWLHLGTAAARVVIALVPARRK